jgi:hypothetical protein
LGLISSSLTNKRFKRFKGNKGDLNDPDNISSFDANESPLHSIADLKDPSNKPLKLVPNSRQTNTRYLFYDAEFMSKLRKKSKSENTTIAAVLVVNALASVRTAFGGLSKYQNKKFPSRQGIL